MFFCVNDNNRAKYMASGMEGSERLYYDDNKI